MAKEFHFSLGDSSEGSIGFCAVVKADTEEEALSILKDAIPGEYTIDTGAEEITYLTVYFNPDAVRVTDIDDTTEVEEVPAEEGEAEPDEQDD